MPSEPHVGSSFEGGEGVRGEKGRRGRGGGYEVKVKIEEKSADHDCSFM